MKKRKLIGLITEVPESVHAKRVLEGVFSQCRKYDYDVAVVATMINTSTPHKNYLRGELNIYELINWDLLDGVIVDTVSLDEGASNIIKEYIGHKLKTECPRPVVSLNMPLEDYETVYSNDDVMIGQVIEHVLEVHQKKKVYFLTGFKNFSISEERVRIFRDVMAEHGLPVSEEQIFYGDFWYSGGAVLADQIADGQVEMPEAIICASDHMAIGLANRLQDRGFCVPQDVIITGFEATQEAAISPVSVTSVESNMTQAAADAVDILHRQISPEEQEQPFDNATKNCLHLGMSCGCAPDVIHSTQVFKDSFYYMGHDYARDGASDNVDIGLFMEGYVAEFLSIVDTPLDCIKNICNMVYFVRPYTRFSLCLKENWLDLEDVTVKGYPEKMKLVIDRTPDDNSSFAEDERGIVFDTRLMLPSMGEGTQEPCVYYFSSVHFHEKTLGYAVLQRTLREPQKPGVVYRNWLRTVNNSLEMIRTKNRLKMLSIYDEMTGVYNRRGMNLMLPALLSGAREGDDLFVAVIDMDRLKYINDNFGHAEGDFGIKTVCTWAVKTMRPNEICVRAGGDEFYIIGVGQYDESEMQQREKEFYANMELAAKEVEKPYLISASIGCAMARADKDLRVDDVINEADVKMYKNKAERQRQRK